MSPSLTRFCKANSFPSEVNRIAIAHPGFRLPSVSAHALPDYPFPFVFHRCGIGAMTHHAVICDPYDIAQPAVAPGFDKWLAAHEVRNVK
jgi:hypothetical protein